MRVSGASLLLHELSSGASGGDLQELSIILWERLAEVMEATVWEAELGRLSFMVYNTQHIIQYIEYIVRNI